MGVLTRVTKGMEVIDQTGDKIGEVDYVYFGENDPSTPEVEAATISDRDPRGDTLVDMLAEVFTVDEMPEELRERLKMHGFIKLSTGLLRADRYIMPDQIAGVAGDKVHLNVEMDELAHA